MTITTLKTPTTSKVIADASAFVISTLVDCPLGSFYLMGGSPMNGKKLLDVCDCSLCQKREEKREELRKIFTEEIPVKEILLGFVLLCSLVFLMTNCQTAHAYTDIDVVNAIYKAENSKKFPYGIKSIKVTSKEQARKICLNSVRNAKKRWIKAGCPGDFITFMGLRYSPPSINPNWVRLVKTFLKEA